MEIKAEFEVAKWDKEPLVQMLYSILLYYCVPLNYILK